MNKVYKEESRRVDAFSTDFEVTTGIRLDADSIRTSSYNPNDHYREEKFCLSITAAKNEVLGNGSDPVLQAATYYMSALEKLKQSQSPYIGFAGIVFSARPQVELLTPLFPFNHNSHEPEMQLQITRAFSASRFAILTLKDHYNQLAGNGQSNATSKMNNSETSILYPYKTSFANSQDVTVNFQYLRRLDNQKLLFLAITKDGTTLCVKFTQRYSKAAHEHCAGKGVAPKLYAMEMLAGGWYMVVMEYLDNDLFRNISFVPAERAKVDWAVQQLHEGGFVHGDVRDVNMKVRKELGMGSEGVMLLDFDWAGIEGEVSYPPNLNTKIPRGPGAEAGALIRKEHDHFMIDCTFNV